MNAVRYVQENNRHGEHHHRDLTTNGRQSVVNICYMFNKCLQFHSQDFIGS